MREKPNVLFVMTDQQRFDTIAALGNGGSAGAPRTELHARLLDLPGVRTGALHPRWKYLFFANGGRELLFDLQEDAHELCNVAAEHRNMAASLRAEGLAACRRPAASDALQGDGFKVLPFRGWQWHGERTYQFDRSRGITGFPENPGDAFSPTAG